MKHSNDEESNQAEQPEKAIEIPPEALSPETLAAVIDSFILREGTDYGREELPHESKVARVRAQLARSDIKLIFDASTESITFMTQKEWQKYQKTHSAYIQN